jgi:hypothetical protein
MGGLGIAGVLLGMGAIGWLLDRATKFGDRNTAELLADLNGDYMSRLMFELASEEGYERQVQERMPRPEPTLIQRSLVESGAHPAIEPLKEALMQIGRKPPGPLPQGSLAEAVNQRLGVSTEEMKVRLGQAGGVANLPLEN